jgi:hypothetical protein
LITIWQKNPIVDNDKGTISFVGGIPGGYIGDGKQVFEITFMANNIGQSKIDFQDIFSVYLNDGLGTQVNPWMEPINLNITAKVQNTLLGQTVQNLLNTDQKNNHIPLIVILVLFVVIIVMFVKIKLNKKRA